MNRTMTEAEMKKLCNSKGSFYFSKDTIDFWKSKLHTSANKYGLFVESVDNFDRTERIYSVKAINVNDGSIATLSDFGNSEFDTLQSALDFKRAITLKLNSLSDYREKKVIDNFDYIGHGSSAHSFYCCSTSGDYFEFNTSNPDRFICG